MKLNKTISVEKLLEEVRHYRNRLVIAKDEGDIDAMSSAADALGVLYDVITLAVPACECKNYMDYLDYIDSIIWCGKGVDMKGDLR